MQVYTFRLVSFGLTVAHLKIVGILRVGVIKSCKVTCGNGGNILSTKCTKVISKLTTYRTIINMCPKLQIYLN